MINKEYLIVLDPSEVSDDGEIVNPIHHVTILMLLQDINKCNLSHVEMRAKPITKIGIHRIRIYITAKYWQVVNVEVVISNQPQIVTELPARSMTWEEV